jgi:hypothetical protein
VKRITLNGDKRYSTSDDDISGHLIDANNHRVRVDVDGSGHWKNFAIINLGGDGWGKVFQINSDAGDRTVLEHYYIGGTPTGGRNDKDDWHMCMFAHAYHEGDVILRNGFVTDWYQPYYCSSPANPATPNSEKQTGRGGTVRFENCYTEKYSHTAYRLGSDGSACVDSVAANPYDGAGPARAAWVFCGEPTYDGLHADGSIHVGSGPWDWSPKPELHNCELTGRAHEPYSGDEPGSDPDLAVPDGTPDSPEAAVRGSDSGTGGSTDDWRDVVVDASRTRASINYRLDCSASEVRKGERANEGGDAIDGRIIEGQAWGGVDSYRVKSSDEPHINDALVIAEPTDFSRVRITVDGRTIPFGTRVRGSGGGGGSDDSSEDSDDPGDITDGDGSTDGDGGFVVPGYQECWIGGHAGYNRTVPRSEADVEVSSWDGFTDALSGYDDGDVIYVVDDLDAEPGLDIEGDGTVIVAGDRGIDGSDGPVIEAQAKGDRLMTIDDGEIRFTGIQLHGQYTEWPGEGAEQNEFGLGLHVQGDARAEVDNCDLSGFSAAAIINDSEHPINYHHCHVHDNAAPALGYGIAVRHEGDTRDHIHNCYQDRNRHSINCEEDSYGYHAHHNVCGPTGWNHIYDIHGGRDSIAAHDTLIERVTVMEPDEDRFVSIRGQPRERVRVRDCQLGAEAGRQIEQRGEIKYGQQDKYDGSETNQDGYSRMSIENIEFESDCEPRDDIGAGDGFPSQGSGIEPFTPETPIWSKTDSGGGDGDGDDDRTGDGREPFDLSEALAMSPGGDIEGVSFGDDIATIYTASRDEKVRKYHHGTEEWAVDLGGEGEDVAYDRANDHAVVAVASGTVVCVGSDGELKWETEVVDEGMGSITVVDTEVFWASSKGRVGRLDSGGGERWTTELHDGKDTEGIARDQDHVYSAGDNEELIKANGEDGNVRWEYTHEFDVEDVDVDVDSGEVYYSSDGGDIGSLTRDGQERWNVGGRADGVEVLVFGDGVVYSGDGVGVLAAHDTDGNELWNEDISGSQIDGIDTMNGTVAASTAGGDAMVYTPPETSLPEPDEPDGSGDEPNVEYQRLYLWGDDWQGADDTRLDFEIVVVGQAEKGDKAGRTDSVIPQDETTLIDGSVAANSDDAFLIGGPVREVRTPVPDRLNFRLDDDPFDPPLVDTDESEDEDGTDDESNDDGDDEGRTDQGDDGTDDSDDGTDSREDEGVSGRPGRSEIEIRWLSGDSRIGYAFDASGDGPIEPVAYTVGSRTGDRINPDGSASGNVGPDDPFDRFVFTGELTSFAPLDDERLSRLQVTIDGEQVDPRDLVPVPEPGDPDESDGSDGSDEEREGDETITISREGLEDRGIDPSDEFFDVVRQVLGDGD